MKSTRRRFLRLGAAAAALPAMSRAAWSQTYPARPVRWVVGFPAGSSGDMVARLTTQWLAERLGQPFVVENRPGAGGNIATEIVARAPSDGYTLLAAGSGHAINATLNDKQSVNFLRDIAPIAGAIRVPNMMVVNPSFPAKTVPEFIAYAKANPGKINMASAGNGTTPHLTGELFKLMTDVNMLHVPYRGTGPALNDLLAGQMHVMFGPLPASIEFTRTGKLHALAVTTAARWDALPDLPTVAEFMPGFEASTFYGVGAPKNTPAQIIDKLNNEINLGLANPTMKARFLDLGGAAMPGSPADFGRLIAAETAKWANVVKVAGIRGE
jgi:tripartite-type tricarboxylate transporter receptor subunit TctC